MLQFAQAAHGLGRAEALFHPFAFDLTDGEARMARRAPINRTPRPVGMHIVTHVRRRVAGADASDEVRRTLAHVGPEGAKGRSGLKRRQRLHPRVAFGGATGSAHIRGHDQSVTIVHQHTPQMTEPRRRIPALPRQADVGIGADWCVAFERFSWRKFTVGLRRYSSAADGVGSSFGR